MTEDSYHSKRIKDKISKYWMRGREYYRVVPKPDTPAQKEIARKWNFDEVYLGKPVSGEKPALYIPRGHERAEELAQRRSKENNMRIEVSWTFGPYGLKTVDQFGEDSWMFYKLYDNGIVIS